MAANTLNHTDFDPPVNNSVVEFDSKLQFPTIQRAVAYCDSHSDAIGFTWATVKNNKGIDSKGVSNTTQLTLRCANYGLPEPPKPVHLQQTTPRSSTKCQCIAQININYHRLSDSFHFAKVVLLHVSKCTELHKPTNAAHLISMNQVQPEMIEFIDKCIRSHCTTIQTRSLLMEEFGYQQVNDRLLSQLFHQSRIKINGQRMSDSNALIQECIQQAATTGIQ